MLLDLHTGSQEAGKVVWYSSLLKNFPQFAMIPIVNGFGLVNEADVFLKFSCFFHDPMDVDNLISVPLPFLNSAETMDVQSTRTIYAWFGEF